MNNNNTAAWIIGIIIVLVLVLGGWWLVSQGQPGSTAPGTQTGMPQQTQTPGTGGAAGPAGGVPVQSGSVTGTTTY